MSDFGWGLVLLGVYVLLVVLARWLYIARSNVVWTDAQWRAMTKRLDLQVARDPARNGRAPVAREELRKRVEQIIAQIEAESPHSNVSGVIGWNGSHQIAQWVLMHEAERLVLPMLGHEELVARLERALGQLDELPQHRREAWQDVIHTLLAARDGSDHERLRRVYQAYLDELLGEIYEASNGKATQLSGLYNRATWVILVALLPLVVLAGLGYGVLLVAGAIGGIVSRMQRLVFSKRIPIAYGSSWAPLFCAPILGALAAWAGLVLIALLQATGVLQLTALATSLEALRSPTSAVLGTAILLGMSERFLLRLEKQAEAVIDPNAKGPSDQYAPANTPAAVQRVGLLRPQAAPTTTTTAENGDARQKPTVPPPAPATPSEA
jgi:hypothetical protein